MLPYSVFLWIILSCYPENHFENIRIFLYEIYSIVIEYCG